MDIIFFYSVRLFFIKNYYIVFYIRNENNMKFLKKLLLTILILMIVLISILFIIGYSTYTKALKEKPLINRVTEITTKENFIKFDNLSEYYRNAVIAPTRVGFSEVL